MPGRSTPTIDDRPTATVVGGGPAGLMVAEVLATAGWKVSVHDHMPSFGRKLLLAGRGGLNITHSEPTDELIARYGVARARLEPAVRAWDAAALRSWCAGLGETTFVGSSGRVFPSSFRATPLLRAWLRRLDAAGVEMRTRERFVGFVGDGSTDDGLCTRFATTAGETVRRSDVVVLALGGASWPRVGSDGGWVEVLRSAGVDIAPMRPANCGLCVDWRRDFVDRFEGVPVKNVELSVAGHGGEQLGVRGDLVVTTAGLEGGPVYACSAAARDEIERSGSCTLTIDLQPDRSVAQVTERLARARTADSVSTMLRRSVGLSAVASSLVRELGGRHLSTEPDALAHLVKALPVRTSATMRIDRAISSAGGVRLDEVDDRYMLRRLPGVFVAGEMIDWEAPTGGYLLQASLSTAVASARGAMAWLDEREADTR